MDLSPLNSGWCFDVLWSRAQEDPEECDVGERRVCAVPPEAQGSERGANHVGGGGDAEGQTQGRLAFRKGLQGLETKAPKEKVLVEARAPPQAGPSKACRAAEEIERPIGGPPQTRPKAKVRQGFALPGSPRNIEKREASDGEARLQDDSTSEEESGIGRRGFEA